MRRFKSILHINDKIGQSSGAEEYIDSLTELCSQNDIKSYCVYGEKTSEFHPELTAFHVPGLTDRNAESDVSQPVTGNIFHVQPDVVCIHNIFDWRIVHAIGKMDRTFILFWYVHGNYLTCLTELRSNTTEKDGDCRRVLSEECLDQIRKGNCIKPYEGRKYCDGDYHIRKKLLDSTEIADSIIVMNDRMKDIMEKNVSSPNGKIEVLPGSVSQPESIEFIAQQNFEALFEIIHRRLNDNKL